MIEEKEHFASKDIPEKTTPKPAVNKEGIQVNFRIPISRKVLLYITLPIIILGLLLFGLIQQGFVGGWLKSFRKATATVTVMTLENKPLPDARVIFGDIFDSTNEAGVVTVNGLFSGQQEMSIQKTGYIGQKKTVNLKKGDNNLGTIVLSEAPTPKVNLTLSVTNYISEEKLSGATVKIGDISGSFNSGDYSIKDVPIGTHKLEVSADKYNTLSVEIVVEEKTQVLEPIKLVPSGVVVFESNRDGGRRGIYTANYDGTNQNSLVKRVGDYEDYTPILGPNQNKVFFTSTRDGIRREGSSDYKTYLYLIDVNGSNLTKISENSDAYAVWSPDGGYIGYTKYKPDYSSSELHTYDVVQRKAIKFTGYNSDNFSFSQSGQQIAFSARTSEGENKLYIANSNATNIKQVASSTSSDFYGMEFIGGKLRYNLYDNELNRNRWYEYEISTGKTKEIIAPAVDREAAVLSPDNKTRAYVSTRDGKSNVYLSDVDGKNERKLTSLNQVVGNVLWSKDGTFVMFDYRSEGESARYLVSTNGKAEPKKIVDINLTYYY